MYSQIPISPSLSSKYNSVIHGGQRKLGVDDMNTPLNPHSNNGTDTNLDGHSTFDSVNRDSELNRLNTKKSSFPHGSFRPSSSNTAINNGIKMDFDTNNKVNMDKFPVNLGNLPANETTHQIHTSRIPMSTPLPAIPPPPIPIQNNSSISGALQSLSPSNAMPNQFPNNLQSVNHMPKPFLQNSSVTSNFHNMPIPSPPKAPFSDLVNNDSDSSLNKKMQDNKERLEQLNISRAILASKGSPSSDRQNSNSQDKSFETTKNQSPFQSGRNSISHIAIQEPNSNKNISRSNQRLPPKVPGINNNNGFKLNISQPTYNHQISNGTPDASVKNMDSNAKKSIAGFKDTVRPPTAPTFFPSNKSNLDINNNLVGNDMPKTIAKDKNHATVTQSPLFTSDFQSGSRVSQSQHQISSAARPPTAPNSISKSSSLPKVDLLINLMDKTVENKRKEFEKLNKLKSALSELGDFNKKLLEENTRLKSGNNSSSLHEGSLLSRDLQNSPSEFTNNFQTPMSDTVNPFIPDPQDPETQISSLKTIINKKNQRILELERKLSSGGLKEGVSAKEIDIYHSLLQKLRSRDEDLNNTLEEIQGSQMDTIIQHVNNCLSTLEEKNYGKLKTIAIDVLNQIEFNYKALSVTLDHLFEQQSSTLENLKHEEKVDTQLESSNFHSILNSREYNTQEVDSSNKKVDIISNSPKRSIDGTVVQESSHNNFIFNESQRIGNYSKKGDEPCATQASFSDEKTNCELSREMCVPHPFENSGINVNHNETAIQNRQNELNLYNNGLIGQETREYAQKQILDSTIGNDNNQIFETYKNEDHSSSTQRIEQKDFPHPTLGLEQEGLYNGYFGQNEGNYIAPENVISQDQGIEYVEGVPPPVFAAYYEGGDSENNNLNTTGSIVNTDGLYFENHLHYQVPANYSNI